jgi:hypothetical protein
MEIDPREDYLSALLLAMLLEHCRTASTATGGELVSRGIKADTDAMLRCAEDGFIEITKQAGPRVFAVVLPEGRALLERLSIQQVEDINKRLKLSRTRRLRLVADNDESLP